MNYYEYFLKCRENFEQEDKPSLEEFYKNPVVKIPIGQFGEPYTDLINDISSAVKDDFDSYVEDDIMLKHKGFWKYEGELKKISNFLVPYLENNRFGCHLHVDKIYIYRTLKLENRESSYLWHYDNNPAEIVKNIIYLNDVTEENSPFEYMGDVDKKGLIVEPSRRGPGHWRPPPNNSRLTTQQIDSLIKSGYSGIKVVGKKGLTYSFCNDTIHRANPIMSGYRDVLNIRVKPTLEKAPEYINKKWTTGFETSGEAEMNPEIAWRVE